MSINIKARNDVSYLFSSLGSGASGVAGSNFLADYASIKNGSYGKLMKAYYSENSNDSVKAAAKKSTVSKNTISKNTALTKEESKEYAKVQTTSDALKESADALLEKKLFEQKDITTKNEDGTETVVKGYDTDAIYKAVNSFVKDYNSVIAASKNAEDGTLSRRLTNMENLTAGKTKALSAVGITVKEDGTLSLDKDAFSNADMLKVKSLFNGNGSYGYQVSAQASLINFAADNVINKGAYNTRGSYGTNFSSGNLFNTYF